MLNSATATPSRRRLERRREEVHVDTQTAVTTHVGACFGSTRGQ